MGPGIVPIPYYDRAAFAGDPERFSQDKEWMPNLVLLAKNATGYQNLIKLCSIAHIEGFYYKPRIDTEVLRRHHEGLIALSACAGGVVSGQAYFGPKKADAIIARMETVVCEELARTQFSLIAATRDSRLGFQFECDYVYTPYSLREKLASLRETRQQLADRRKMGNR